MIRESSLSCGSASPYDSTEWAKLVQKGSFPQLPWLTDTGC